MGFGRQPSSTTAGATTTFTLGRALRTTFAPTPSIRHTGRKIRPSAGRDARNPSIPGVASNASNCDIYPAASQPSTRTSQPCPCGNRTCGFRSRATRTATGPFSRVTTTTGRDTTRSNRRAARCNRCHNVTINPAYSGIRNIRAAINPANPAIINPNRRANSGAATSWEGRGVANMVVLITNSKRRFKQINIPPTQRPHPVPSPRGEAVALQGNSD